MDYEKKYPITQIPGKYMLIQWERGYQNVEVSYEGRLITAISNTSRLKKGMRINDDELGVIELKFSERPMAIDAVIDGFHSVVNRSHPEKELKRTAAFFWIIAVFAVIASLLEGVQVGLNLSIGVFVTLFNVAVTGTYFLAAVFTAKSKPWAYIMGFVVFAAMYLLFLLSLLLGGSIVGGIIGFIIRSAVLGVLIYNLKTVVAVQKHARHQRPVSEELLDA